MSARTFQPVRAASFFQGAREHRIWHPYGATKKQAWQFHDALIAAAERFNETSKTPEHPAGLLGYYGPRVLKALLSFADFMSGRLDPSHAEIALKAKVSVRTVVRCLARLREHKFVGWIHRCVSTGNDGAGPQVQQITNAYWFALKGRAAGLVKLFLARLRPPLPDDELARHAQREEATEAMLDRTSAEEVARFRLGVSPLGDALASLGRALDTSASDTTAENPDR